MPLLPPLPDRPLQVLLLRALVVTRAPYVRIKRRAPLTVPLDNGRVHEPPACNVLTRAGKWCVRDEGHRGGHLPLPATYPPAHVHGAWCHPSADGCPERPGA